LNSQTNDLTNKVVLITGAAQRIGAEIARTLHRQGASIAIHFRQSADAAQQLKGELEAQRANSCALIQADLGDSSAYAEIIDQCISHFAKLDVLINNASSFYATPVGQITLADWDDLMASNLKAPLFLSQAAAPHLHRTEGCIVNIVDIHAERPLKNFTVYCVAKAGLAMLTKSLARELGPEVRVNAVAPGAIMWPEHKMADDTKSDILSRTALKRQGNPSEIAKAVLFLVRDATYTSGHILTADGGRSLNC
jgi:pteridine reductase